MAPQEGRQRRRVLFSGHVQGVGFRYRTWQLAQDFAVVGFVRNLGDGRVELVVEGEPAEVDRFVTAVQEEMEGYIQGSHVDPSPGSGEFHGFEIRS